MLKPVAKSERDGAKNERGRGWKELRTSEEGMEGNPDFATKVNRKRDRHQKQAINNLGLAWSSPTCDKCDKVGQEGKRLKQPGSYQSQVAE